MMRAAYWACMGLVACGAPRVIDDVATVNRYVADQDYVSACGGVRSNDPLVQTHTTDLLANHPESKEATACLCEALHGPDGAWDADVATALANTAHDGAAACLASTLSDPKAQRVPALLGAIGAMASPAGFDALAAWFASPSHHDDELAAAAVSALAESKAHTALVRSIAVDASKPAVVRAAAVSAQTHQLGDDATALLTKVLTSDPDMNVRLAAVGAMGQDASGARAKALCVALEKDADGRVRAAAAKLMDGTNNPTLARCLAEHLKVTENSPQVRQAVLDALRHSKTRIASDALCEQIGPFLRAHVKDAAVEKSGSDDIVDAQNYRDYERTADCVKVAVAQGGYSCHARAYLATWTNDLGGRARIPTCPGAKPQP